MTIPSNNTTGTPSDGSKEPAKHGFLSDLIRAAAEDLRIIGHKGRPVQQHQQKKESGRSEAKPSPAEARRALWATDSPVNIGPQSPPDPAQPRPSVPPSPERSPGLEKPANVSSSAADIGTHFAVEQDRNALNPTPSPVTPAAPPPQNYSRIPPVQIPLGAASAPEYGASSYHGEPESEQGFLGSLHPLRIIRVARRKWATILLIEILAFAGAWFYLSTTPKIYRAMSVLEMSLRRPRIMSQQGAVIEDQGYAPTEEIFNTRLARFNGSEMRELAFTRFKSLYAAKGATDGTLRTLMSGATFALRSKTKLVDVICNHTDKTVAPLIANAFAEAAELYSLEENRAASDKAVAWLVAQARTQRELLEKAEQAIAQFRMQNNIDVLEGTKKSLEDSAMSLGNALVQREGEVILLQDLVHKIDALEIKPETAGGIPDSIPRQQEIKAALEKWGTATTERDSLLTRYTPQHPDVIAKTQLINLLRSQVEETIKTARATAQSNLELLQKQTASLRAKDTELSGQIAQLHLKIVEANSRLTGLKQERDACDVAYRGILNRIEEARLAADENTATVKIIERAVEPSTPYTPRIPNVLLTAVLAGLGLGLGLALLADTLEDRVSSADDVERRIGLRILGLVPHVPRAMRQDIVMANMTDKRGHVAEVFAGIRVLLNSRQYADHSHSVLVVSSGPEDGKTITACNLAIASAQGGMRTLLVDFDLRRPRVGRIFGIPDNQRRLAEILNLRDLSLFPSLPQKTACENLQVIGSRTLKGVNASDIFGSGVVSDFVAWAHANYDRVIIDSPPFGAVSDCVVLASLVGSVIVVCRPVMTRKQSTRFMLRNLVDVGANVIGAVINDVDFSKHPYFSNYYHQYHYSYTYGEHDKRKGKREPEEKKTKSEPVALGKAP